MAIYQILSVNQDADISFMQPEQADILNIWKVCFEEEEFLALVTASGAVDMDDGGTEVSSKGIARDIPAEIDAILPEEANKTAVADAPNEAVPADAPIEAIPEAGTESSQPSQP